jgi:nucleotide-binding universal stress UspA family protein
MKNILVPTDFSNNSLKAALYAAEIAKKNGATVSFLNSVPLGSEKLEEPLPLYDKYKNLVLEEVKEELEKFRDSVTTVYPNLKTTIEIKDGAVVNDIVEFSDSSKTDLIVMGTKGASGIKEVLVGTVAADTISRSHVPVLVVPGDYEIKEPGAILFATHHFEETKALLSIIMVLARLFSATIHVVVFIDLGTVYSGQFTENNERLTNYINFLSGNYPDVKFKGEVIDGKDFENAIGLYHLHHQTDMAAMITYPKGFWEKIFHKSCTRRMAFHSTTPVLAIHYHE